MLISFQAIIFQVLSKEGRSHLVAIVKGKCSVRCTESTLKNRPQSQKRKILKARSVRLQRFFGTEYLRGGGLELSWKMEGTTVRCVETTHTLVVP